MPTRSRTNIDARLVELEKRRDRVMDRLVDRYIAIEADLYTLEERQIIAAAYDADQLMPVELMARFRADPRAQALDQIYGRFINWRETVERLTNKKITRP